MTGRFAFLRVEPFLLLARFRPPEGEIFFDFDADFAMGVLRSYGDGIS
jgi:hypothetical protein